MGILDNTTELYMEKYILGEISSFGGATLYKNPSDQTVYSVFYFTEKNNDDKNIRNLPARITRSNPRFSTWSPAVISGTILL